MIAAFDLLIGNFRVTKSTTDSKAFFNLPMISLWSSLSKISIPIIEFAKDIEELSISETAGSERINGRIREIANPKRKTSDATVRIQVRLKPRRVVVLFRNIPIYARRREWFVSPVYQNAFHKFK